MKLGLAAEYQVPISLANACGNMHAMLWVDCRQGVHPALQQATCKKTFETWMVWHHVLGDTHKALCVG